MGWAGYAKVDGVAYNWLGVPGVPNVTDSKAVQKRFEVSISIIVQSQPTSNGLLVYFYPEYLCYVGRSSRFDYYVP